MSIFLLPAFIQLFKYYCGRSILRINVTENVQQYVHNSVDELERSIDAVIREIDI